MPVVRLCVVCELKNVIRRGFVKQRKTNQNIRRKITQAALIAAVLRLLHSEELRDLLLRQIVILTQLPQAPIIAVRMPHPSRVITVWC